MTKQNLELWLAILRDSKRVKVDDVEWLIQKVGEITNIFASSILTLKGKDDLASFLNFSMSF